MAMEATYNLQRKLSIAQAIPIIGPIAISPIKSIVSIAQIITGIAGTILFGTFAVISNLFSRSKNINLMNKTFNSLELWTSGMISLIYSKINMITFGIFGLIIELSGANDFSSINRDEHITA